MLRLVFQGTTDAVTRQFGVTLQGTGLVVDLSGLSLELGVLVGVFIAVSVSDLLDLILLFEVLKITISV